MASKRLSGRTSPVTGASSGLGSDFAHQLAADGADLILVARRQELLETVAADIRRDHGVRVDVMTVDLAGAREQLAADLRDRGRPVQVLINNAGFGVFGDFRETDWARLQAMLEVDVVALTHLTRLFVNDMVACGEGYIMRIASTGAFQPTPTYAAHSAAKSYVLSFGHALHFELRGTGVSCTTVCPGVTPLSSCRSPGSARPGITA